MQNLLVWIGVFLLAIVVVFGYLLPKQDTARYRQGKAQHTLAAAAQYFTHQ